MYGPGFDPKDKSSHISGYADATSVNIGESIHLMVSTGTDGLTYRLEVFRMGWYSGAGARRMASVDGLVGRAHGYWHVGLPTVAACPTCEVHSATGLVDVHWPPAYTLSIPNDWASGVYMVKLTAGRDDALGDEAYIQFVVRDDARHSDLLVQLPANTYQAYNQWGGASLYKSARHGVLHADGSLSAVKVSFNRPYAGLRPDSLYLDVELIRFLERNGYDVTYTTSVDVDANPDSLLNHRAFLSSGHDEYWTRAMRAAATRALDHGVSLGFFGGNDVYWQARYEADAQANPRRVLVMYREAKLDPMAAIDPANATVRFIDPPVNQPQNSLTGTIFGGIIEHPLGVPWVVADTAPSELLARTGLKPGDAVEALAGKECDSTADNGFQPAGLVVIAASPMTTKEGNLITCNSTWYRAASGARVFNAGTLSWNGDLDQFGHHNPGQTADRRIMALVRNILGETGSFPTNPDGPAPPTPSP